MLVVALLLPSIATLAVSAAVHAGFPPLCQCAIAPRATLVIQRRARRQLFLRARGEGSLGAAGFDVTGACSCAPLSHYALMPRVRRCRARLRRRAATQDLR